MFKQAIIYYPTDKKVLKQINKDIAALHCAAAVRYMDTIKLSDDQKAIVLDGLISNVSDRKKISA